MAEFCIECLNRIDDLSLKKRDVATEFDMCEGCGKICPCVISIRRYRRPKQRTGFFNRQKREEK